MWGNHGTKIIGVVGALATAFSTMSPDQLTSLLGANGQNIVMGVLSVLTILRGFQNSKLNGTQGDK